MSEQTHDLHTEKDATGEDATEAGATPRADAEAKSGRRNHSTPSSKPFQLAVCCGVDAEMGEAVADSTIVIDPADPAGSLARTGLSASDLRARAIVAVDGPVLDAVSAYATVCGLASRFLDVATPSGVVLNARHRDGRGLNDSGKAPVRAELVVVSAGGDEVDDATLLTLLETQKAERSSGEANGEQTGTGEVAKEVDAAVAPGVLRYALVDRHLDHLSPGEVSELRSARRVLLTLPDNVYEALFATLYCAGVRARKEFERLPLVYRDGRIMDLDELRRAGASLRRSQRRSEGAVAEPVEATDRQQHLAEAAAMPVGPVLAALGSLQNGELWSCPRPWSHNHGDANPSMQANGNKVRCHVDDAEWIDSLRLVIEACGVTPDEAAGLLLGPVGFLAPFRDRIVAERERRAGTA